MADMTIVSSSIVRPQNIKASGRAKIHLTPFDLSLLHVDYPQRGLLFPKPDPVTPFIPRLKTSLSTALEIYFPFAGRLVKLENLEDKTMSFFIDCDDSSGARFVHAIAETISINDLLPPDGSVPDFIRGFFPMNGVKNREGVSEPLLALQVTEMKDGVFISFGYNHLVADGSSMWKFFHDWSKICLNGSCPDDIQPLKLTGWFLDEVEFPIHVPVSQTETGTLATSGEVLVEERVFHFTKNKVSDLKAKANGEVGSRDMKISSFQAVTAHLWRSIIRHSGLNRSKETYCIVAADFRQRVNPPLEKECFGNVTNIGRATATVGDLVDHGLGWAALQISKMVSSLTDEYYRTHAESWVRNVKVPRYGVGGRMLSDSVAVASSPWFQVYDNDFGWGKPIAARSGLSNITAGVLMFFRGLEEGSIDVHTTLSPHVLINLVNDVEFLDA